jgi:hypothetical protein
MKFTRNKFSLDHIGKNYEKVHEVFLCVAIHMHC